MRRRLHKPLPADATAQSKKVVKPAPFVDLMASISMQTQATELKIDGFSNAEIAEKLGIQRYQVPQLLAKGLEETTEARNKKAELEFKLITRRYERIYKAYALRAHGWTEQIENEDGSIVDVHHPPDPVAGRMVLKILKDFSTHHGFNKLRVEHTGAHGGPIMNMNMNIDWSRASDEQLAQANAGNIEVIRQLSAANSSSGAVRDPEEISFEEPEASEHH